MKIAFILYEGMTALDLIGVYDPLTRLKSLDLLPGLAWDFCAFTLPQNDQPNFPQSLTNLSDSVKDLFGLRLTPNRIGEPLSEYDLIIIPGGHGNRILLKDHGFLTWLKTARPDARMVSVCSGSLLLAAAGFLDGKSATTHPNVRFELEQMGIKVIETRLVEDGNILTGGGVTAGVDLGLYLCKQLAGEDVAENIRHQMDYPWPLIKAANPNLNSTPAPRTSYITRQTTETNIELTLSLDGKGQNQIDTGLPFLDHMLTQIAIHGLFDLVVQAQGDLQIDPHHTLEDVALSLGQAFQEALGNRAGIVRMATAGCPMDESLASVTVDFSGRPYSVIQIEWTSPEVGGIPTTLFTHFLESFAAKAGCNLHAKIVYGLDDHHKAEALFKAFGRALSSAVSIDLRRLGAIPSSKGILL
jgi:imidazoleglycerol-phosphate dehydratase